VNNPSSDRIHPTQLLALLPIAVAVAFTGTLSSDLLNDVWWLVFGLCLLLVLFTVFNRRSIQQFLNSFLALLIAYYALGTAASLWLLIFSVLILNLYQHYQSRQNSRFTPHRWTSSLEQISVLGLGLIVTTGVHSLLRLAQPLNILVLQEVIVALIGAAVGYGVLVGMQRLYSDVRLSSVPWGDYFEWSHIALVLLLPLMAPFILINLNVLVFVIYLLLVGLVLHQMKPGIHPNGDVGQGWADKVLQTLDPQLIQAETPAPLFEKLYRQVQPYLPSDWFIIAAYHPETEQITYPFVIEQGQVQQWEAHLLGGDSISQIIRDHALPAAASISVNADLSRQLFMTEGVLLKNEAELIGMVLLGYQQKPPFPKAGIQPILEAIAKPISLILRSRQLQKQSVKIASNLSIINRSMQDVMFNLDQQDALKAACKEAITITQANKAAITLTNTSDQIAAGFIEIAGFAENETLDSALLPVIQAAAAENPFIITDVQQQPDEALQQQARRGGFRSLAAVPLRSGTTSIGYLVVFHDFPRQYLDADLSLLSMLANQLAAALDNAELLQALEHYASEQAQLVHLSRISSSDLSLRRVIDDVTRLLQHMLDVPWIEIGLFGFERNTIEQYTRLIDEDFSSREIELDAIPELQQVSEQVFSNPLTYHDKQPLSASLQALMQAHALTSMILTPMIINQEVIGYIALGHQNDNHLSDNERRLVEVAANQIAAQIHNAQLYTLTENALIQRLAQLAFIEEIAQQISRSLDLSQIIDNVLEAAIQATQAQLAMLALPTHDNQYRIQYQMLLEQEVRRGEILRSVDEGIIGEVARTGELMVIHDNRTVDYYVKTEDYGFLSSLAVPLRTRNEVLGVLNIESTQLNFFTDEQISFIKSLAGHAVISIQNAKLLQERQYQIDVLTNLRELAIQVAESKTPNEVYKVMLQIGMKMLGSSGGAIYTYKAATQTYDIVRGAVLINNQYIEDVPPIPDELIMDVAQYNHIQAVSSVHDSAFYDLGEGRYTNYESIIAIPIERRGRISEILCVMFNQPRYFTQRDQNTIELLAYQVSNQLENAMLNTEIRANHDRMRAILDATRDGIILLDRSGRLQDANLSAEEILGLELSEYINKPFAETLYQNVSTDGTDGSSSGKEALVSMARILRTEPMRIITREYVIDNQPKPIYIKEVGSPVRDNQGEIIGRLLSLRDITEEKSLAAYRELLMRMLLHDLRGPLGAIISGMALAEELVRDPGDIPLGDTLIPTMQVARESAEQLMALVDTLLDIAKMRRGQMALDTQNASLTELADNAYKTLAASFQEANLTFEVDIADELDVVNVDVRLIVRVITNLLHNAVRFTPRDGKILITADRQADNPDMIRALVCDTGPGIPPEMRERIFNEFEQIEGRKPEQGGKGSGLGLAFCKLAVESHKGVIVAEPKGPLSGACISFTIPLAKG